MARFQKSFSMKIEGKIDARVRHAYEELEGIAACAGIRNNYEQAKIARRNHHGWTQFSKSGGITFVPARRFVDVFMSKGDFAELSESIKSIIRDNITAPTPREWEWASKRTPTGINVAIADTKQTKAFGSSGGAKRIMQRVAKEMKEAQVSVIGSDRLPTNAPSTIKRKKRNAPLLDKGKMRGSIEHWVEDVFDEKIFRKAEDDDGDNDTCWRHEDLFVKL